MLAGGAGVTGALFARYLLMQSKRECKILRQHSADPDLTTLHGTDGRRKCQHWNVTPSKINTTRVDWGWPAACNVMWQTDVNVGRVAWSWRRN
jgi:hypothetical protein